MSRLDAIKARLGSIPHGKVRLIASVSPAAHRLLFEDLPRLIAVVESAGKTMIDFHAGDQLVGTARRLQEALTAFEVAE